MENEKKQTKELEKTDTFEKFQAVQDNKKNHIGLILFLILIIIGLVGYICYDKGVFDTLLGKDKTVEPKQEKKLSEEEVMKLHDSLIWKDTEADLFFDKSVSIDTMSNELVQYVITKYGDDNNWQKLLEDYMDKHNNSLDSSDDEFDQVASVSKNEIESIFKEIFNYDKSLDIKDGDIYNYRAWNVKYSSSDSMFYLSAATAGAEYGGIKSKMIKYEEDNDKLYMYDKVVMCHVSQTFGCFNGSSYTNGYIVTKEQDSKIKNESASNYEYDKVVNYDYIFNTYDDKLDTFKTTFKKGADGKYYWYSSEIVNE